MLFKTTPFADRIDVTNVESSEYYAISIPKDGPYAVNRVHNFQPLETGDVLLIADNKILHIGSDGLVKSSHIYNPIEQDISASDDNLMITSNYQKDIYLHNELLYMPLVPSYLDKFSFPSYYQHSILGVVNLESKKLDQLPIKFPNTGNIYYGGLHDYSLQYTGSSIIVTFKFSPDIYIYTIEGQLLKHVELPPYKGYVNQPFTGSQTPQDEIFHLNNNIEYGKIYTDDQCRLSVQFCKTPSTTNVGAIQSVIRIFDTNFNLVSETDLPKYYYRQAIFVDGSVFVKYLNPNREGTLEFRKLSIKS